MKKLIEYTKNGYHFLVRARIGDIAIFYGTRIGGTAETWEIIRIQSHNGREIGGNHFPPAEYPPSNEQWGSNGWTRTSEESAFEKMMDLVSQEVSS